MKKFAAVLMVGLVAACAGEPIHTTSGRPDATVHNVSLKCFKSVLMSGMVDGGWSILSTSETQLVGQRPVQNGFQSLMLTNGMGVPPMNRVTFTFIEMGSEIRIVRDTAIVVNAGNRNEMVVQQKMDNAAQQQYETALHTIEAKCQEAASAHDLAVKGAVAAAQP